jgi:small conductance mechanosensitive channel
MTDIGLRVGLAVVAGFLFQRLLFLVVGRGEKWIVRVGRGSEHARQRARTVGSIFRSLLTGLVAGAVIIYSLEVMGWDVRPLLGGAAVLGVALGFGAQTLVRDVIAGVFILTEDQFGVGDLIEVSGLAGTVEGLTVRSTTLRDFHGYLHFVPNGEMKVVVNRSRGWNRVAVDVPIAADENVDVALDVCRRVAGALSGEPGWRPRLLDEVQVWGVEALGGQEVQIRMVVRSLPGSDAHEAARELRRRVHRALVEAGLRLGLQREIGISAVGPAEDTVRGKAS